MHYNFFYDKIVKPLNKSGHDIAFFFLEYTLTPRGSYPTQLRQAVEGVRYILNDTHRPPSRVILGGDSAGANLVMSILLHLSHPHPAIEPIELGPGEKLGGALACSPWVSFSSDWPSVQQNKRKDIIYYKCSGVWAAAYLNGKKSDSWSEPFLAPTDWWTGVKADHVLFTVGTDEVLASSILSFARNFEVSSTVCTMLNRVEVQYLHPLAGHASSCGLHLLTLSLVQKVNPDTEIFVAPNETHIAHIYSQMLTFKKFQQGQALRAWLTERV